MRKRSLERTLSVLEGFSDPDVSLEQYPTPAGIAAHLVHLADVTGDLGGPVVDLGCGTGVLAIGAALRGANPVIGVDVDREALATAVENERCAGGGTEIDWLCGEVGRIPLCLEGATVLTNPPFGAQTGSEGADRPFLEVASEIARVSYSIHNAGSRAFVEAYASALGGELTHAYALSFDLDRQFAFHTEERRSIDAECFRVQWSGGSR
ncbi:METTL5 family protein [Natronorarus salvus]|uniref:METTL5 family protein n=1 Tax=Natronorarus salvus TaxID=3117733 RepID=UPI002F26B663